MSEVKGMKPLTQSRTKPRTGGLGAWVLDQRGSPLIEFVLVLPLFLILVFGSFAVWKIVSAKQSLASGTYQAARYLSVEGRFLDDNYPDNWEYEWEQAARVIIVRELENNSLLRPLPPLDISFESIRSPSTPSPPGCPKPPCMDKDAAEGCLLNALFTIRAEITLLWPVRIPFLDRDSETIILVEKRTSYRECDPISRRPTPTPSPTLTPTPGPTPTPTPTP